MITQLLICIFGLSSIFLINLKNKFSKYGPILGIISQPLWFYESYKAKQWGIFILTIGYTISWIIGIYKYWINGKTTKN